MNKFCLGNKVKWGSQSSGFYTEKKGEIVKVLPAGKRPLPEYRKGGMKACGLSRDHESYIVKVQGKSGFYWPIVKNLKEGN